METSLSLCVAVYDMLEQLMLRRNIKITFPIRFGYRTIYVIFTTFVAITLVRRPPPAPLCDGGSSLDCARAPHGLQTGRGGAAHVAQHLLVAAVQCNWPLSSPLLCRCVGTAVRRSPSADDGSRVATNPRFLVRSPSSATCWASSAPSPRGRPPSGSRPSCGSFCTAPCSPT
jgi:hypothetical protein